MKTNSMGVLFDLDGTILDTAPDLGNALNHVLSLHNKAPCTYAEYRATASHGSKKMLELGFGDEFNHYDFDLLKTQFLEYYEHNISADTRYFDGMENFLITLNDKAIPWGIVTNKPKYLTTKLLTCFPLLSECQVVVSGDSLPVAKPHPAPLLFAAEKIQRLPERIWYIGDAERDIQAAKAANMISVLASYGYIEEHEDTEKWLADYDINSASQLPELILSNIA